MNPKGAAKRRRLTEDDSGASGPEGTDGDKSLGTDSRRQERNLREQRRSNQISQQIEQLKEILNQSGYSGIGRQANKFTVLHATAEYIRDLQDRNDQLAARRASIAGQSFQGLGVKEEGFGSLFDGGGGADYPIESSETKGRGKGGLFIGDIDYKHVFSKTAIAMAIANTDGILMDCNNCFITASGFSKDDLMRMSLFALIRPDELQQTYSWLALVLNKRDSPTHYSRRAVVQQGDRPMVLCMSLVRNEQQHPVFFHLALVTPDAQPMILTDAAGT